MSKPRVVIDRPKGTVKTFTTSLGRQDLVYPLNYGYVEGVINPQDNEEADVFIGSGGPLCGRFMKGKPKYGGGFEADEYKWFVHLSGEEYKLLFQWWHNCHDPEVTWDWVLLDDSDAVWADMRAQQDPTARIREAVARHKGNKTAAAAELGLPLQKVYDMLAGR